MRVLVLGTLELAGAAGAGDGDLAAAPEALRSARLRRLLALLAVRAGEVVSVDRIADAVWGDGLPSNVDGAVHNLVSRLRAALKRAGGDDGGVAVLTRAPGYLLQVGRDALDATSFEDLLVEARAATGAGRHEDAVRLLDEALALWRGPAYAEFTDEDFARAEAARLDDLRTGALEDRVDAALSLGRPGDAIMRLEALVDAHPLRERPHAQLMTALYRTGRQADALAVYREYRNRLQDELGLDPSAALQDLHEALLRQDDRMDWRPPPPPAPPSEQDANTGAGATAAVEPAAGNLQSALPDLVGREQTIAETTSALEGARVITLVGPGGVGKSSLALHAASRLRSEGRYPDGVWLCELAAVGDGDAVADAVATVLGIQQRQGVTAVERLVEYLRPKQLLLVLDNCEHVAAAAATLAAALVQGCPTVTVLATGREPLGIGEEHVRPVPPLTVPPPGPVDAAGARQAAAVRLFAERAAAAAPQFTLTDANAAAVAEVCRRLDGVPLAIELAAMRMRSMTPSEIIDRLGARFRFLRSSSRIAAERHRTLRAVVDWSYALLEEPERLVFDRLSVFAGSFPLEAAEHVAAGVDMDALEVVDLVGQLVDKSMVLATPRDGGTRYVLLESLRDYGRERLTERGEMVETLRRHAAFHVGFAEEADAGLAGPDHARWAEAISAQMDELRAAFNWALAHDHDLAVRLVAALYRYTEHRMTSEVSMWASRALEVVESGADAPALLPTVYAVAAAGRRFAGDLSGAGMLVRQGLAVGGEPRESAHRQAAYLLVELALFEGQLEDVEAHSLEAGRLARAAGDSLLEVWVGLNRALARAYAGDTAAAVALAEDVCVLADGSENPAAIAWSRYSAGEVLLEVDPERSAALLDEALANARAVGERYLIGVALLSAASLRGRHGDPREALPLFVEVIEHWHRAGNWTQQWTTIRNVVDLLTRIGEDEAATVLYGAVALGGAATRTFGADADRLAGARATLADRLDASALAAAIARGAAMADDDIVTFACAALDAASG